MPKKRSEIFRKPIFRLLLELLPMIEDIISDKRLRIDHPRRLLEPQINTLTQKRKSKQLIGKQILGFIIPNLPHNKILLLRL